MQGLIPAINPGAITACADTNLDP